MDSPCSQYRLTAGSENIQHRVSRERQGQAPTGHSSSTEAQYDQAQRAMSRNAQESNANADTHRNTGETPRYLVQSENLQHRAPQERQSYASTDRSSSTKVQYDQARRTMLGNAQEPNGYVNTHRNTAETPRYLAELENPQHRASQEHQSYVSTDRGSPTKVQYDQARRTVPGNAQESNTSVNMQVSTSSSNSRWKPWGRSEEGQSTKAIPSTAIRSVNSRRAEDELEATRKAADSAHNAKALESALHMKTLEVSNLKDHLAKMQNNYDQLHMRYAREASVTQDQFRVLRNEREELKKLLETQAVELTAAREFTFMTDKVAAADVTRAVEDLNSMIYQTTLELMSIIPPDSNPSNLNYEQLFADTMPRAVNVIGEQLFSLIISRGKDDESLAVLALQSGLACVCSMAVSSWIFGNSHGSKILEIVYDQIRTTEKQAVAGRWRSLTSKQLSSSNDNAIRDEILTALVCILFNSGWKDEPRNIRSKLEIHLSAYIDEVVTSVSKASKMIREEFVSDDLQVVCVQPGQTFDASLMDMKEDTPNVRGRVLGTVDLGLALRNRSGGQDLILKPKVVINTYMS
ncbi:hypothetical protein AX15_005103 [Amanita polypyramis BW_CC]|nr:hypothetical protein AX15_005103 [Amanita polypyramis BW_CC]